MKRSLKSRLVTCILILVLASTVFVPAGDVTIKEGTGTFDEVLVSDGSASAPSYSFSGDTDTGIYRSWDGDYEILHFVTEGVERFRSKSGQELYCRGNFVCDDSFGIKDSLSSNYFGLIIGGTAMTLHRQLTLDMHDASRTLDLTGNATLNQDVSTTGSPTFAGLTVDSTNHLIETNATYNNVGIGLAPVNWGKLYVYGDVGTLSIDGTTTYGISRFRSSSGGTGLVDCHGDGSGHAYIMNGLNAKGLKLGTRNYYSSSVAIDIKEDRQVLMPYVYSDTVGGTNRDLYIDDTGKLGYVSSSINDKENIRDATNTDWIYNLRVVDFDYKDGLNNQTGLIAEEVELVEPRIVSYKIDETLVDTGKTEPDPITGEMVPIYVVNRTRTNIPETVNYGNPILISSLIEELQNLKQENQTIKAELAAIKQKLGMP